MSRWLALDRLRAAAVILMVQGHAFTALLRRDQYAEPWAGLHGLLHGLTGPAFLLGAGLAFGLTTYPHYERHHRPSSALWARLRRYALLLVIGYSLQLPGGSIASAFSATGSTLAMVVRVGPLQMIGVTLAMCQLLALLLPSARAHARTLLFFALLCALASPWVYRANAAQPLAPFWSAFLDDRSGSQYPLFPNAAFALVGAGLSPLFSAPSVRPKGRALVLLGAGLAGALYLVFLARLIPYDRALFWRTSPALQLFRAALVVMALGLLERRSDRAQTAAQPGWTATLARHSLIAYVAHLLILYGTPLTPSLVKRFGLALNLAQCCVAWLLVMTATVAIARTWEWLSRERVRTYRLVQAGLTLLGLVMLAR